MANRSHTLLAALLLACSPLAQATPFTIDFSTLPGGGSIQAQPGALTGWGYRIQNQDESNWFVATGVSATSFALGTPDAGFFDFPIVAPGALVSQAFSAATSTGLYAVSLLATALPGQIDVGVFTLIGEWWSGDPFGGGDFLRDADDATTGFTLGVERGSTTVPISGTAALILLGTSLLIRRREPAGEQLP